MLWRSAKLKCERSPAVPKCERSPAVPKCERSPAVPQCERSSAVPESERSPAEVHIYTLENMCVCPHVGAQANARFKCAKSSRIVYMLCRTTGQLQ